MKQKDQGEVYYLATDCRQVTNIPNTTVFHFAANIIAADIKCILLEGGFCVYEVKNVTKKQINELVEKNTSIHITKNPKK